MVFPSFYELDNYPFTQLHGFVKNESEKKGFHYLDLLDSYKNYSEKDLVVNMDDTHPNEFAHGIAAQALKEYILKNKII